MIRCCLLADNVCFAIWSRAFVRVCSWVLDERNFSQHRWCGTGRPPASRLAIFKAFVLKIVIAAEQIYANGMLT